MQKKEVKDLIDKIKVYRPYFQSQQQNITLLINEWYRILEPYANEDINRRLDEFLKNGDNVGKEPDVYQLCKGLQTIIEKSQTNGKEKIQCRNCRRIILLDDLQKHTDRCNSVIYVKNTLKEFFDKELTEQDIAKLYNMSDKEFDDKYYELALQTLPKLKDNPLRFNALENYIYSRKGLEAPHTLQDLARTMVN